MAPLYSPAGFFLQPHISSSHQNGTAPAPPNSVTYMTMTHPQAVAITGARSGMQQLGHKANLVHLLQQIPELPRPRIHYSLKLPMPNLRNGAVPGVVSLLLSLGPPWATRETLLDARRKERQCSFCTRLSYLTPESFGSQCSSRRPPTALREMPSCPGRRV